MTGYIDVLVVAGWELELVTCCVARRSVFFLNECYEAELALRHP